MRPLLLLLPVLLSACASNQTVGRRHINLPSRNINAPFSDAVMVGNTVYLAGRLGLDPQTGKPPADPAVEARLLIEGFRDVLEQAGMTLNDMVSVQVFCSDVSLFDTWNQVYRSFFSEPFPARAFVGSGPLLFGARFEMLGIAARR